MSKKDKPSAPDALRIRKLTILNYKKLDKLELQFPAPVMAGELDIIVLGSKNGGGKTSVLECCSLVTLAGILGEIKIESYRELEPLLEIGSQLIKAGKDHALITGDFVFGKKRCSVELRITRAGFTSKPVISGDGEILKQAAKTRFGRMSGALEITLSSALSLIGEPLIFPPILHFNSYRKVQESNPEFGMMAENYPHHRAMRFGRMNGVIYNPVSAFKQELLQSLMGKADLFEGTDERESEKVLNQLNALLERYCGGRIDKLKPQPDNKVDFRISPHTGGESFSFDGLSSGQKEIVATLFLIWRHSRTAPAIVLIDEPELHLNAEWHADLVERLRNLAPYNQYILATHSEDIFRSVEDDRRSLLVPDTEGGKK
jgi:AAA domain, putative AbiEii toxin, Type IV TA system